MEDISLNIAKFNIHAIVIIGGFEVRLLIAANVQSTNLFNKTATFSFEGFFRRSTDGAG